MNSIRKFLVRWLQSRWDLAFYHEGSFELITNPYKDRWFADPFILDVDAANIVLLVEEYPLHDLKGNIAEVVVDRAKREIVSRKTILSEETQLSFPYILKREAQLVYLIPENSHSGKSKLYAYDRSLGVCRYIKFITDEDLSDPISYEDWILATAGKTLNANELRLYRKNQEMYQYERSIYFEENIARNAGNIFCKDGKLYRPAQVNNQWYGEAVSIQKIVRNTPDFSFEEVARIYPPKGYEGIHTWNTKDDIVVTDLKYFKCPWMSHLFYRLKKYKDR